MGSLKAVSEYVVEVVGLALVALAAFRINTTLGLAVAGGFLFFFAQGINVPGSKPKVDE